MRNAVRFRSSSFNTTDPKRYFSNPGCFGDDLGHWLRQRLESLGYQVTGPEPEPENRQMDLGLQGEVPIITGGSRGASS